MSFEKVSEKLALLSDEIKEKIKQYPHKESESDAELIVRKINEFKKTKGFSEWVETDRSVKRLTEVDVSGWLDEDDKHGNLLFLPFLWDEFRRDSKDIWEDGENRMGDNNIRHLKKAVLAYFLDESKRFLILPFLSFADLEELPLAQNMEGANLQGAYLVKSYLAQVQLQKANLQGANLTNAYMAGTNLQGANLKEAILNEADLIGANMTGAAVSIPQLLSSKFLYQTQLSIAADQYSSDEVSQLEEKIIRDYAAALAEEETTLRLIQSSSFSPLDWGKNKARFQEEYVRAKTSSNTKTEKTEADTQPQKVNEEKVESEPEKVEFIVTASTSPLPEAKSPSITINTDSDEDEEILSKSESEVVNEEKAILEYNFEKTKKVIESLLEKNNLVDVLLDESRFVGRNPPSMWIDISNQSPRELVAKISTVAQVLKEYQDPKGTYWFNVSVTRDNTTVGITPHFQNTLRNTHLSDDFEERFKADYNQHLPIEKNKENLAWLDIYIRGHLNFHVCIPVDEHGARKIQFQITGRRHNPEAEIRPEELSALNLAFKDTGLNFRRDDNDLSVFLPLPGPNIKMLEKNIVNALVRSYEKNYDFLRNTKIDLLISRTKWEAFVDWLQDHPKTSFGLSIVGLIVVIPTIIIAVAYFGGTNSTKPINDFITALGKGDENCIDAQTASATLPSQSMKDIAGQVITLANLNSSTVQHLTDDTPPQKPEEFESLLSPNQPQQQASSHRTDSNLKPK